VVIGAAAGGAWWYFFRRPELAQQAQVQQAQTEPSPVPAATSQTSSPAPASGPLVPSSDTTPAHAGEPAATASPVPSLHPGQEQRTPAAPPTRAEPEPLRRETTPSAPPPHGTTGAPPLAIPTPQRPAPQPVPAPAEETEEEEPVRRGGGFGKPDVVLRTGLELAFRPTPADAWVLVDGTQIGKATGWNGLKGSRTYSLDGTGEHQIKLRSDGMMEYRILVQASETAGVTPILSRLQPLAAAQADASDLKTYRVREAIAFKVDPPGAAITVDGQPAGTAKMFGGRFAQPSTWLKLPNGRHRIGVSAPGRTAQDFIVEVSAGADEKSDRIEVSLQPGGNG
jgi:hypothetical protein